MKKKIKIIKIKFVFIKKKMYLCIALINNREANKNGFLAQLVEQRTENPCVPGSIPGETT